MRQYKWVSTVRWLLFVVLALTAPVMAQEEAPLPTVDRIFVTESDVSSLPNVELLVYGRNAQGGALDFTAENLTIRHGDTPAGPINFQGAQQVGTFTLFLIDIPPGVADQLPLLQEAINQFASPEGMVEQVDAAAVFKIGEREATQLLEPTRFYNSVRNLFAAPLAPETGPTALIDSSVRLLEEMDALKPDARMAASIVLMTDGTDAVSSFAPQEIARTALRQGIPVHTIWMRNENLTAAAETAGQDYLAAVSAASGGVAVRLENSADLPLIWQRIAEFRDQARIQYEVSALAAGDFPVTVNLAGNSATPGQTTVTIPANIPSIVINLPAESRTLSLPNLDRPVTLKFDTTLTWLDGVERELEAAQLVVNDATAADVPVERIDSFEATLSQLVFGNNTVQVVVLDNQGMLAKSPPLALTVNEGPRSIPAELRAGFDLGRIFTPLLVVLLIVGVVGVVWFLAWRTGWLRGLSAALPRGRRREPSVTIVGGDEVVTPGTAQPGRRPSGTAPSGTTPSGAAPAAGQPLAYLEVLEAQSAVPATIPLRSATVRIGRSPAQTDVAFEQDVTVSRMHAVLMLEGNQYRIFDERSTSGTWVNERQVPEYGLPLRDGDDIYLGAVHLRFRRPAAS